MTNFNEQGSSLKFYSIIASTDDLDHIELFYSTFDVAFNKFEAIMLSDTCRFVELWVYIENQQTHLFVKELFDEYNRENNYSKDRLLANVNDTGEALRQRMINMHHYMIKKYNISLDGQTMNRIIELSNRIVKIIMDDLQRQEEKNEN